MADLLISQTLFRQMLETSQFINVSPAKVSLHTVASQIVRRWYQNAQLVYGISQLLFDDENFQGFVGVIEP